MHTQNAKTERRANMQEYIMQENMEILGPVPSCNALNKVHYQVGIVDMMLGRKPMVTMSYIEHCWPITKFWFSGPGHSQCRQNAPLM